MLSAIPYVFLTSLDQAGRCVKWARLMCLCAVLALLPGCARDSEAALRAKLDQWFMLGETAFFTSKRLCTGAMIMVTDEGLREDTVVQGYVKPAQSAFVSDTMVAIRMAGKTPAELADALLLSGSGTFGKQALAASALAGACFKGSEVGSLLYEAFHRQDGVLAYDIVDAGLMLFDPQEARLFYIAGDVW